MKKDVIIALDFSGEDEVFDFLDKFSKEKPYVKIGMELFYAAGPDIVRKVKSRGHKVFLDLKLHDIPHTIEKTAAVLAGLDIDMCNVHAAGGTDMMKAAVSGFSSGPFERPQVIAVTQLTSTGIRMLAEELLIKDTMEDTVVHYARSAKKAGMDGVVCSVWEAGRMHRKCGADFLAVTPGIRFADNSKDDQKRIAFPGDAGKAGSDLIVIGRPVTGASDPEAAFRRCRKEFSEGHLKNHKKGDE